MGKVILNDIIEVISGGTPQTSIKEYWENGTIGWLSINDFNNDNRRVFTSEKKITEKGLKNSSTKLLQVNDIIISARGTVGKLAQIGCPMAFNQSCFGLRGKKNIVDNTYLYYSLKNYVSNIQKKGQGSVFNTINLDSFKIMEIEIEECLPTQQKIASVLSALDDKIELNNRINTELEAMAKTLYDYWFVQFDFPIVTSSGVEKPYKSSGGKMVYNETLKREIPEGWEVKTVGNILDKNKATNKINAKEYLNMGKIPVIDQSTNFICGFTNDESSLITTKEKPAIVFGDHTRILKLINFDFARGADGTQILFSKIENMPQFLLYYSLLKIDLSNYGYARHFKFLKEQNLLIPKKEIAKEFNDLVKSYYVKIYNNLKQNQELSALRDWLLPMLMNGQVSVGEWRVENFGMVAEEQVKYKK